jgi:hypothetical protein
VISDSQARQLVHRRPRDQRGTEVPLQHGIQLGQGLRPLLLVQRRELVDEREIRGRERVGEEVRPEQVAFFAEVLNRLGHRQHVDRLHTDRPVQHRDDGLSEYIVALGQHGAVGLGGLEAGQREVENRGPEPADLGQIPLPGQKGPPLLQRRAAPQCRPDRGAEALDGQAGLVLLRPQQAKAGIAWPGQVLKSDRPLPAQLVLDVGDRERD